jgi:hypothetical protein
MWLQLVLGMRVAASCGDENVLWPGTLHRIERTRARVNFDSHPLGWRKAQAIRLVRE